MSQHHLPTSPALLPAGLRDLLPPEAEAEAAAVEALMEVFARHGYQRLKPPLLEFEDTLFAGSGTAVAEQTFRLMDPESQRMMGLRADTTPQVARIATTRLAAAPRPLRLSYAGQVLHVRGTQLNPDRQMAQAGIELIGSDSSGADAEIVLVAAEALAALGLTRVSFDLTMPTLAPALLDAAGLSAGTRGALARALDRKDAASVRALGGAQADTLTELLLAAGPADRALEALAAAALPATARRLAARLAETVAAIRARAPGLRLTLDPLEFRGFRYHTGVCVTVYAPGRTQELGRGGRYVCGEPEAGGQPGAGGQPEAGSRPGAGSRPDAVAQPEPATGITLYPDLILRVVPPPAPRPRLFVPAGSDQHAAAACRERGFATIAAVDPVEDPLAEARRLLCTHILRGGDAVQLNAGGDR